MGQGGTRSCTGKGEAQVKAKHRSQKLSPQPRRALWFIAVFVFVSVFSPRFDNGVPWVHWLASSIACRRCLAQRLPVPLSALPMWSLDGGFRLCPRQASCRRSPLCTVSRLGGEGPTMPGAGAQGPLHTGVSSLGLHLVPAVILI